MPQQIEQKNIVTYLYEMLDGIMVLDGMMYLLEHVNMRKIIPDEAISI